MIADVVVTGVGVVSPIGIGKEMFWNSLLAGKSGVKCRPNFEDSDLPARIYAPVNNFDGRKYVTNRKALKVMCVPIQFGYVAAKMAFEDSGLDLKTLDPDRVGTIFGTETFFADPLEVAEVFRNCTIDKEYHHEKWGEFAMRDIQPLWMLKYLPNMVASHISIALDARGPSNSICQAEASGLLAIIEGADLIRRGVADVVVAGGTGSRLSLNSMMNRGFSILSKRIGEPERASRPFDLHRDGMVAGEGAGAVILESAEFARARGKVPIARLAGWSRLYSDPQSNQTSTQIEASFKASLKTAKMSASDIGHIHAHGTGQIVQDQDEGKAIANQFGDTPVLAPKGNFGNLGPGSAAVELVAALMCKQNTTLPPNLNYDTPDPECPVNIASKQLDLEKTASLKFTSSSTGQLVSIVID